MVHKVKATREGLIGHVTAAGLIIRSNSFYVSLPSTKALWRIVRLKSGDGKRSILAPVLDVGPWNEHDEDYVFGGQRPLAESGRDERDRVTNGAGIDLSEGVVQRLNWKLNEGSAEIEWEFVND